MDTVELGLELTPMGPGSSKITLYYTDPSIHSQSQPIASFQVASDFKDWTRIGLAVSRSEVALYFNCDKSGAVSVTREPESLQFDPHSTLFLGQAGPEVGGSLDGDSKLNGNLSGAYSIAKNNYRISSREIAV
ncbi:hypothetical protein J6590_047735 [Homalodisca vitripennis]|nr:hypothetical protein J6590_047735 [Homalodisca vitripennis]